MKYLSQVKINNDLYDLKDPLFAEFISGQDLNISVEGGSATEVVGDPLIDGMVEDNITYIDSGSSTEIIQ